jgi:hypothetical protein
MARRLTSDDVVKEVEFELAVGAVGRDELGQAIQSVQQYHNKLRGEAFEDEKLTPKSREALNRQLQFNEIVLSILREAAEEIRVLRLEQRRIAQLPEEVLARQDGLAERDGRTPTPAHANAGGVPSSRGVDPRWPDAGQVERCLTAEQLQVALQAERTKLPLLGGLLTRLRLAGHQLALFYTQRLAERQVEVNRIYGDALLTLVARCEAQEQEISTLRAELAALQARSPNSPAQDMA